TEKAGSDKTFEIQSLDNANFTDTQKISQHEAGCFVEPSKLIPVKKLKGKLKVKVEPNVMKKQSPAKTILQQKAQQSSPVAEVKPLNTTVTSSDQERTTTL
ncbi:unnamed protein product, partial [Staurois parvus]